MQADNLFVEGGPRGERDSRMQAREGLHQHAASKEVSGCRNTNSSLLLPMILHMPALPNSLGRVMHTQGTDTHCFSGACRGKTMCCKVCRSLKTMLRVQHTNKKLVGHIK